MKEKFLSVLVFLCLVLLAKAQNLDNFTVTLTTGDYLSIASKKAYKETDAAMNKSVIDFVLLAAKSDGKQKLEWYNMSGKDGNVPGELLGTATLINAISFDREQFDKCKTATDLKRMTGHITKNSLSHFAVIRNSENYYQHCFAVQQEDGRRGLIFVTAIDTSNFIVEVKAE